MVKRQLSNYATAGEADPDNGMMVTGAQTNCAVIRLVGSLGFTVGNRMAVHGPEHGNLLYDDPVCGDKCEEMLPAKFSKVGSC